MGLSITHGAGNDIVLEEIPARLVATLLPLVGGGARCWR